MDELAIWEAKPLWKSWDFFVSLWFQVLLLEFDASSIALIHLNSSLLIWCTLFRKISSCIEWKWNHENVVYFMNEEFLYNVGFLPFLSPFMDGGKTKQKNFFFFHGTKTCPCEFDQLNVWRKQKKSFEPNRSVTPLGKSYVIKDIGEMLNINGHPTLLGDFKTRLVK